MWSTNTQCTTGYLKKQHTEPVFACSYMPMLMHLLWGFIKPSIWNFNFQKVENFNTDRRFKLISARKVFKKQKWRCWKQRQLITLWYPIHFIDFIDSLTNTTGSSGIRRYFKKRASDNQSTTSCELYSRQLLFLILLYGTLYLRKGKVSVYENKVINVIFIT